MADSIDLSDLSNWSKINLEAQAPKALVLQRSFSDANGGIKQTSFNDSYSYFSEYIKGCPTMDSCNPTFSNSF